MSDTQVPPQAQDDDDALYACEDDTPREARIRRSLVRLFATTPAFMGQSPGDFPHLAADVAMRIVWPALVMVTAEAEATARAAKAAVAGAAEETLAQRLAPLLRAARASERAACIAELRGEAAHLAAAALEARGPDVAVATRDVVSLESAARSLASRGTPPQ